MIRACSLVVACALLTASARMPAAPAPSTTPSSAKVSLDAILSGIEKEWLPLAEAMPADKYAFAPSAADFAGGPLHPSYAGTRTFGQEVAHVAMANFAMANGITGKAGMPANMKALADGVDKPTATKNLADSFAALHAAIATLTPENEWLPVNGPGNTRAGTAAYNFGHMRDHYGQLVEYLRMNGITPPASQNSKPANPVKTS